VREHCYLSVARKVVNGDTDGKALSWAGRRNRWIRARMNPSLFGVCLQMMVYMMRAKDCGAEGWLLQTSYLRPAATRRRSWAKERRAGKLDPSRQEVLQQGLRAVVERQLRQPSKRRDVRESLRGRGVQQQQPELRI